MKKFLKRNHWEIIHSHWFLPPWAIPSYKVHIGRKEVVIWLEVSDCGFFFSPSAFRYLNNHRDTCRVNFVDYMDEIAAEIGVKPNLPSLFLRDPKLAMEIFFGPCTPYQYRLQGPGKWAGARRAILTQRARIIKPLRTRTLAHDQPPHSVPFWLKSAFAALLLFVLTLIMMRG